MLRRGRPIKRQTRSSTLVLCEGSKTEPNYIGALVREFGLTAVSIPRTHDTDPLGLVQQAIDMLEKDRDVSLAFVVFDRDTHLKFNEAVQLAEQSKFYGVRLKIIRSFPSFEVWLLHHFEACRAPLTSAQAMTKLKSVFPEYRKESVQCIEKIIQNVSVAINNSRAGLADAHDTGEMNSSTEMHLLVAEFAKMST